MNTIITKKDMPDGSTIINLRQEDCEDAIYTDMNKQLLAQLELNIGLSKNLDKLLKDKELRRKQQEQLLKGEQFDCKQIIKFFATSSELGYKYNQYTFEKIPSQYTEEQIPKVAIIHSNGTIEQYGNSMNNSGVRNFVNERKKTIVRIAHKDDIWHCFIFDYSGLAGRESGEIGSTCHIHYISNTYGMDLSYLLNRLRNFERHSFATHIRICGYR